MAVPVTRFEFHLFTRVRQKECAQPRAVGSVALMKDDGAHTKPSRFERFNHPTGDRFILRLLLSALSLRSTRRVAKTHDKKCRQS